MKPEIPQLQYAQATITVIHGRPLEFPAKGIVVPANQRAIMGAGLAGEVRLAAGHDVEHQLRRHVPLLPGTSYITGPGNLQNRGVAHIAHAVVIREPGSAPRRRDTLSAIEESLHGLDDELARTVTIPFLTSRLPERRVGDNAHVLAELLTGHLRRGSKLSTITIAGLDVTFVEQMRESLRRLGAEPVP